MNKKEILDIIKKKEIQFIQLQFINIHGELHSVEIPVNHIEGMLNSETMIDGSSIKGYTKIDNSDLYLKPDLDTFLVLDFINTPYTVARFICDVLNKDGTMFEGGSRQTLRRVEEKASKSNYKLYAGLEAEFFLLEKDENGKLIPVDKADYFGTTPGDTVSDLKREMAVQLMNHGFDIEAFHKEVAPGQHEINFKYDTALKTADRMITFKWIVKTIADQYGLIATFMPKPFEGKSGSGLHSNISIFKDGKNMFCNDKDELSKEMMHFIAGIIKRTKEMSAITNASVNSYKRLIPGFEAPNCIAWSDSNRSAMIRVPASRGAGTRVEVRSVDATSNPYIMLAALFSAGIEGIEKKETPLKPVYENLYKLSAEELKEMNIDFIPCSLGEALELFKESEFLKEIMGECQFEHYYKHKLTEWKEFNQVVHQWEIEKYIKY
ncbi:type I glutamate--ammonia ligase [Mycoplasma todarodis]|uniref:type I glutamate--ammonia ligase n=1 Tax=Mycoplasma todarodis TaxID=1937191 RepID=UPI003B308F6E